MLLDCEGIIEEAIMLGAPVTGSADEWCDLARVVSGRIVNGYSRSYHCCSVAQLLLVYFITVSDTFANRCQPPMTDCYGS